MQKLAARKFFLLNSYLFLMLLCGCHSNAHKAEAAAPQQSSLRTISINPNVKLTPKPIYRSVSGSTAAVLAGPLVGLAVQAATDDTALLKTLSESKEVDITNLALNNFREQLAENGAPIVLVEKDAEAELRIEIDEYGLIPHISTLQPIISINARLIKPDGTEIWSDGESHPDMSGVSAQTWNDYVANPSLLKGSYNEIIQKVTIKAVKTLFEDHRNGEIKLEE